MSFDTESSIGCLRLDEFLRSGRPRSNRDDGHEISMICSGPEIVRKIHNIGLEVLRTNDPFEGDLV